MLIEICAANLQSALNAQSGGAQRIELCSNLEMGGTTPGAGLIRLVRQSLHIQVFVLIRPRGGDFCYSQSELEVMRQDIRWCKSIGIDGVVIGALTPDAKVDMVQMQHLVSLARPMQVTFHRAFDQTAAPFEALESIIRLGIHRVLTSGQQPTAWEGRELIRELIEHADGRIAIMPGSGVKLDQLEALVTHTGAQEVHLSAKKKIESSFVAPPNCLSFSPCSAIPLFDHWETDVNLVREVVNWKESFDRKS